MADWSVIIGFTGGDVEIAEHVEGLKKTQRMHTNLKGCVNTCKFVCTDVDTAKLFLAETGDVDITIQKDSTDWFVGIVRNTHKTTISANLKRMPVECSDKSTLLDAKIDAEISWASYDVCDTASKSTSLLHQLFYGAGLIEAELSLTDIAETIDYYVVEPEEEKTYKDEIDSLLMEFGYVYDVGDDGVFVLYELFPSVGTPATIDDADMYHDLSYIRQLERFQAARVTWFAHETLSGATVFADTSGGDATNKCNISLAADAWYPTGVDADNIYSVYSMPDYEIIIVNSAALTLEGTDAVEDTFTAGAKRALIKITTTASTPATITKLDVTGDAVVKDLLDIKRTVRNPTNSEKILDYTARWITTLANAQTLVNGLYDYYRLVDYHYRFPSEKSGLGVNSLYTFDEDVMAVETAIRVVQVTEDDTGMLQVEAEGIDDFSVNATTVESTIKPAEAKQPDTVRTAELADIDETIEVITGGKITDDTDTYWSFEPTGGTIAGWTINAGTFANSTNIILDAANKKISINDATYGNQGIQLDYNAGDPQLYVGDGANEFLKFDGTNLTWKGAKSELDAAGEFTCTGGNIAGWTINATTLTSASSNITLDDTNEQITAGSIIIDGAADTIDIGSAIDVDGSGSGRIQVGTYVDLQGDDTSTIAGWAVGNGILQSATSGARIELRQDELRVSIFDSTAEKVALGYLDGLPKRDGSGNWGANDYGFWSRPGDNIAIDGDVEYVNGDYLISSDSSYRITATPVSKGCLTFNGTTSIVTVADHSSIQDIFDGGGTVSAWIYPDSDGEGSAGRVLSKRNGWGVFVADESGGVCDIELYVDFDGTDGSWRTTSREITIGAWNHIVIVYDADAVGNNPVIYVDDTSVALTETSTPVGTRVTDVGSVLYVGNNAGSTATFDGEIDEVRLYDAALTADDVAALYNKPGSMIIGDLQARWSFDEDDGSAAFDTSENTNDGTLSNCTRATGTTDLTTLRLGTFKGRTGLFVNEADLAYSGGSPVASGPAVEISADNFFVGNDTHWIYFDRTNLEMNLVSVYLSSLETIVLGTLMISNETDGDPEALTNPIEITTEQVVTPQYGSINHAVELRLQTAGATALSIASNGDITLTEDLIIGDGKTIGQAAGPLIAFDDTSNYLEITGCNVGIGTASPDELLHVTHPTGGAYLILETGDSGNAYMTFLNSTTGTTVFSDGLLVGLDTDESATIWLYEANHFKVGTNNAERMRIDSSGNVGIGTSPATLLHIASAAPAFRITDKTNNADGQISVDDAGSLLLGADENDEVALSFLALRVDGAEFARIDTSGFLGVGTESPATLLHIASAAPAFRITDKTNNADGQISVDDAGSLLLGADENDEAASSFLALRVDGTEFARIDTNGFLGVGTESPGNKVDIVTGATTSSSLHIGEADNEGGYINSTVDSEFTIAGGAEYVSGSWYARATTASLLVLHTGYIAFYTNSSLTDGNTFTPTEYLRLFQTTWTYDSNAADVVVALIADTSDGSDDQGFALCGGGGTTQSRGAYVVAYGNEILMKAGDLDLVAGATGDVRIYGADGSLGILVASDGSVYCENLSVSVSYQDMTYNTVTNEVKYISSTERDKIDIVKAAEDRLDQLWRFEVMEYTRPEDKIPEIGFIAEQVETIWPELVCYDAEGLASGLRHWGFTALAIMGVQKHETEIESLRAEVARLQDRISILEAA